eukprot:CAMPEP_0202898956 /NCGR_PEP_ID=MMETSP1392-20130828/7329_1 /ASSEMBLY_ACC=CAM_ASM_000868 /TAXON_ID=225041 /ORGANISM="Chlamydomonas chlamydogama, Strain SAG 11-48b" /LENGTH=287 /DNA_ID=CAMNT_0049585027 /DNA_START=185 /DNA_END=1045 /DNA_ORIENTATION=-
MATTSAFAAAAHHHPRCVTKAPTALGPLDAAASVVSLDPKDYVYGTPTTDQQQHIYQQFASMSFMFSSFLPFPNGMYSPASSLPGTSWPALPAGYSPFFPQQSSGYASAAAPRPEACSPVAVAPESTVPTVSSVSPAPAMPIQTKPSKDAAPVAKPVSKTQKKSGTQNREGAVKNVKIKVSKAQQGQHQQHTDKLSSLEPLDTDDIRKLFQAEEAFFQDLESESFSGVSDGSNDTVYGSPQQRCESVGLDSADGKMFVACEKCSGVEGEECRGEKECARVGLVCESW